MRRYSAADPIFDEGDVFTLTVPLNDSIPAAGQESAPVGNEPTPQLEASTPQVTPQVEECTPQVSAAVKRTLLVLSSGELSSNDLLVELGLKDRKAMQERYVIPALEAGLIERTQANVHAPNQKYRLTESGRRLLDAL